MPGDYLLHLNDFDTLLLEPPFYELILAIRTLAKPCVLPGALGHGQAHTRKTNLKALPVEFSRLRGKIKPLWLAMPHKHIPLIRGWFGSPLHYFRLAVEYRRTKLCKVGVRFWENVLALGHDHIAAGQAKREIPSTSKLKRGARNHDNPYT